MPDPRQSKGPASVAKQANAEKRLERQAAALRANLMKRKALSRTRAENGEDVGPRLAPGDTTGGSTDA